MTKVNRMTAAVLQAQKMYPKYLQGVKAYLGAVPYGQQKIDQRTADKQLVRMTPQDIAQLAASDPIAALTAQRRLETLSQRAAERPPLPSPDAYEE